MWALPERRTMAKHPEEGVASNLTKQIVRRMRRIPEIGQTWKARGAQRDPGQLLWSAKVDIAHMIAMAIRACVAAAPPSPLSAAEARVVEAAVRRDVALDAALHGEPYNARIPEHATEDEAGAFVAASDEYDAAVAALRELRGEVWR